MLCAPKIQVLGNAPEGNKLLAKFTGSDMPDEVNVKDTSDTQPVRGESGTWISEEKYPNPQVTLILRKNGSSVKECRYDLAGNLVTVISDATITSFSLNGSGGIVTVSWQSVIESGLSIYTLESKVSGSYNAVNGASPTGPGSRYTLEDFPSGTGTIYYRLKAVFSDGTEKILVTDQAVQV